jgi:DNA invertase Pin-like site-specific DNA recombinase
MADQKLSPPCALPKTETAARTGSAKHAAIYTRVSTGDQHPETQLYDLRELAKQRRFEIVREYTDTITGSKSKRPGLDQLLGDARRHRFDVVLVAAFDRAARNVRHFLEVLDELNHLNIEFVSLRENIDTGGPLGRAMVVIVGAIAELERSLIVERVKAGMRRAKLEGLRIGRSPLDIDREQVVADRRSGMSLSQVAKKHRISRATVCRLMKESGAAAHSLNKAA